MMRLPPFQFVAPASITEALELKRKHGAAAMYVAGGTDLYPKMKRRQFEPGILIGLGEISELNQTSNGEGLILGAGTTLTDIANDPTINEWYPALSQAAGLVSSPPLRNMGTIGGNLCVDTRCTYYDQTYQWRKALGFCLKKDGDTCWVARSSPKCVAVASSDCAPAAIALDAKVRLAGPSRERTIPAADLYQNDGLAYLAKSADEILVSIQLPPPSGWHSAYRKLRRRGSIDFPILGVAAATRIDEDGRCAEARIVLGAVSSCPVRSLEAEEQLEGKLLTRSLIEEVAITAAKLAKPLDNTDMALGYRKKVTRVFIAEAIAEAARL